MAPQYDVLCPDLNKKEYMEISDNSVKECLEYIDQSRDSWNLVEEGLRHVFGSLDISNLNIPIGETDLRLVVNNPYFPANIFIKIFKELPRWNFYLRNTSQNFIDFVNKKISEILCVRRSLWKGYLDVILEGSILTSFARINNLKEYIAGSFVNMVNNFMQTSEFRRDLFDWIHIETGIRINHSFPPSHINKQYTEKTKITIDNYQIELRLPLFYFCLSDCSVRVFLYIDLFGNYNSYSSIAIEESEYLKREKRNNNVAIFPIIPYKDNFLLDMVDNLTEYSSIIGDILNITLDCLGQGNGKISVKSLLFLRLISENIVILPNGDEL